MIFVTERNRMLIEAVSSFFGAVMPAVLLAAGVLFGVKLRFFYIFHPIKTCRLMFARTGKGISPLRAASMALAGTLGVGNITGVTAAVAAGGAGAVFWMWCSALVAMSVKYAETALAVLYRRKGRDGFFGGAPFYIADGTGCRIGRALGAVFALLCLANSLTVGNILQVNAAARAAEITLGVPPLVLGGVVAILTAAVVAGGARRISSMTAKLIPAVSLLYIFMCAAVIVRYSGLIGDVTARIFAEAFDFSSAAGGIGGFAVSRAVRYGVTRGVLTNEAGSGTSPTAHACADAASPMAQGCLGVFEVFADTIVICSFTAYAVLIGEEIGIGASEDAVGTVLLIFSDVLGGFAAPALTLVIFVFVFATLISQFYYGRTALVFLRCEEKLSSVYLFLFMCASIIGAVIMPEHMWHISDLTVGIMTTLNVICIALLQKDVVKCTDMSFGRGKLQLPNKKSPISTTVCNNVETASKSLH